MQLNAGNNTDFRKEYPVLQRLKKLYPSSPVGMLIKLRALMAEKGINIEDDPESIDNVMASIVRHKLTHYDDMLRRGIPKDNSRFIVETQVRRTMDELRKERV